MGDTHTHENAKCTHSLRAGDMYDAHQAKTEDTHGAQTKIDQIGLAREPVECFLVDAATYRRAIRKNLFDTAVQVFSCALVCYVLCSSVEITNSSSDF